MSKSTKEETSTAVVSGAALNAELMAEIGGATEGYGPLVQVRQELIKTPRIKLTNALSKARKSKLADEGEFACESREKNYGKTITIIPIMISESASLLDKETSKKLCWSDDLIRNHHNVKCSTCPEFNEYWNDWGTKEAPKVPKCKASIDVLCMIYGEDGVVEMNFRKTNYKAGKALVNLIANERKLPPFAYCFTFTAVPQKNDQYDFFAISENVKKTALAADELRYILPTVKQLLEAKKLGNIERDIDEGDDLPI